MGNKKTIIGYVKLIVYARPPLLIGLHMQNGKSPENFLPVATLLEGPQRRHGVGIGGYLPV